MVQSRLNGRAKHFGLKSVSEYIARLRADHGFFNSELTELINRITTNKTDFFRENHHFEFLKDTFFPSLEEKAYQKRKKNPKNLVQRLLDGRGAVHTRDHLS